MTLNEKTVKVLKFGGTSLASAAQFKKVKAIVSADENRRFVVPSAPGKRDAKDEKVTDLLYLCHAQAQAKEDFLPTLSKIRARYDEIIEQLGLALSLEADYLAIQQKLEQGVGADYVASRGEYLNGKILAAYLDFPFFDPAELIFFDEKRTLDTERTRAELHRALLPASCGVIPGFYGSGVNEEIITFSRGGSDITGALVAQAVDAAVYENFTDVSGVLAADPRVVKNARPIAVMTYRELRELSYMGASVLHEDAVFPVHHAKIPIHLQNTNDPNAAGTWIVPQRNVAPGEIVTGIAAKKGYSVLSVAKDGMNAEVGYARRLLSLLEEYAIPFEHMPTGIDSLSVVVRTQDLAPFRKELLCRLEEQLQPQTLLVEDGLALLAVVGQGMLHAKGNAARICDAVAQAGINISILALGMAETTMIVGIAQEDCDRAMIAVYRRVFEND